MEQHCIRHTELPGASRLFGDLLYRFDRVERFYQHAPYDPESLERAAREVVYPDDRRAAVAAALRELNPDNTSLDAFAKPGTVAVVTGQQVGLFGGPLYSVFKALAAARAANSLTDRGICAVPVFWLATEDHDLPEINQFWAFGVDQSPEALATSAQNSLNGPAGPITLRDVPLDALRARLRGLPFADEAYELVADCYREGASFGGAFRKLMGELLKPYGVLFVDPLSPALRRVASPFLERALRMSGDLVRGVQERSRELEAAGYHAQVHLETNASLLFSLDGGKRTVLKRTEKGFNDFTADELAARAEALSPNALLRPVMQDFLLPTAGYLGGPAELAYFAQSRPLYDALLGRMPMVGHRASFTLLDARAAKLTARYGIGFKDIATPDVSLRETMAARLVPAALNEKFSTARADVEKQLGVLSAAVRGFDPGLEKAVAKSRAKMLYQVSKLERKTAREAMRRDQQSAADAQYLHDLVYPHRHLQERFYGVLPFLARHGMDLIDRVYECVKTECPDHQVLTVD
ncbi:MAG: bacillithiol biosynthesis cysteine-adding enzyme BshC [Acidobacteria bacterium]|nr:bacillithiol biosynthesis cysteine-adding enzyme BshC [Acidobacteriota bacterium]